MRKRLTVDLGKVLRGADVDNVLSLLVILPGMNRPLPTIAAT
ncbi:MAG: hypothetical protein OXI17_12235 [Gammaproteobacteria bacterium]|nr:hypothetical protein [Gammaproteobacteria bacterium]